MPKLYTYVIKARNKDNKHIQNFKEKTITFVSYEDSERAYKEFQHLISQVSEGVTVRLYRSVNARDEERTKKLVAYELLTNPYFDLARIESLTASIASQPSQALEKKWLFDIDTTDKGILASFLADLKEHSHLVDEEIDVHTTKNGFAVIVARGFDTRKLLADYPDVELKRDDLLLIDWKTK